MEVLPLVAHINRATDEDFELFDVIAFVNDAIAKINVECNAVFPFIDDSLPESSYTFEEYTAFPDHWQRTLLVPFAAGRIKENDSSQFEYIDWYSQFDNNLVRFKSSYNIPDKYLDKDANSGRYEEDYSTNIMSHLRGW